MLLANRFMYKIENTVGSFFGDMMYYQNIILLCCYTIINRDVMKPRKIRIRRMRIS